jgi:hypothetical protein
MNTSSEHRLRRSEAAAFLTQQGFPVAPTTLAKYASIGGGPIFESFGRIPLYRPDDLLSWARSRSSGPRASTSVHRPYAAPDDVTPSAAGKVVSQ